jgi:hypothetical protein
MGTVYEAVHVQWQTRVALKLLHSALATKVSARSRLLREIRAAAQVRHPNVVRVQQRHVATYSTAVTLADQQQARAGATSIGSDLPGFRPSSALRSLGLSLVESVRRLRLRDSSTPPEPSGPPVARLRLAIADSLSCRLCPGEGHCSSLPPWGAPLYSARRTFRVGPRRSKPDLLIFSDVTARLAKVPRIPCHLAVLLAKFASKTIVSVMLRSGLRCVHT